MKKSIRVLALSCCFSVLAFAAWAACTVTKSYGFTDPNGNHAEVTMQSTASTCDAARANAGKMAWEYIRNHYQY